MDRPAAGRAFRSLKLWLVVAALGLGATGAELGAHVYAYDVSGGRGENDPDGSPSFRPRETFPDRGGFHGGDATEVFLSDGRKRSKGWDAGELRLNLSLEGRTVRVSGEGFGPEQSEAAVFEDALPLDRELSLRLKARGGAGGDGGRGGRGQDGDSGRDGAPAGQYSAAEHGGDGYRGGNEGHSTDGGDAGAGGRITVTLPIEDLDLAMLIDEVDVRGNSGGQRGRGRGVGHGGRGGRGGDGAFVTDMQPYTHTDADGTVHLDFRTVTVWRSSGTDGSRGRDGDSSARRTHAGRDSEAGQYTFRVADEHGRTTDYPERYDLKLLPGFELAGNQNNPGFFEPGETIEVRNLKVINSGKSPTPKYQAVKIFLGDEREWIVADPGELTLPKALEPGETHVFAGESLKFHLREPARAERGVLVSSARLMPRARVARVEREFRSFGAGAGREFRVRYPIQITPLESLVTLAPGEASRARFRIRNVSGRAIGASINYCDLRAARSVFRRVDGACPGGDLVLAAAMDGREIGPGDAIERAIEGLGPGEEILVETLIGLKAGATPYTKAQVQPELFLESLLEPGRVNRIQFEPFTLNVAAKHVYRPGSDVLLVANHALGKDALDALQETAARKNLTMDIWDFSYYGFFDFSRAIGDYESIFRAYRGKTILILANDVATPLGAERVDRLISPDRVIEAARRFGIKIAILGTSPTISAGVGEAVDRLTSPLPFRALDLDKVDFREFASPRDYVRALKSGSPEIQRPEGDEFGFLGVTKITVSRTPLWPWSPPSEKNLARAALKVARRAGGLNPETKTFIEYEFVPRGRGRRFGPWRTWELGHLYLRASVDQSKTSVLGLDVPALGDADFIRGGAFQATFDFALNFSTKLNQLNEALLGRFGPDRSVAETMLQTLLLDLVHEQNVVRPLGRKSEVPRAELRQKLDLLRELSEHPFEQFALTPETEAGRMFLRFIAKLRFYNERMTPWWQRVSGLGRNGAVAKVTEEMIERLLRGVFADVDLARFMLRAERSELRREARAAGGGQNSLAGILDPQNLAAASVRDGDRQTRPDERVRTLGQSGSAASAEAARALRASDVAAAIHRQNTSLRLSAAECARLLSEPKRKETSDAPNDSTFPGPAVARPPARVFAVRAGRRAR